MSAIAGQPGRALFISVADERSRYERFMQQCLEGRKEYECVVPWREANAR